MNVNGRARLSWLEAFLIFIGWTAAGPADQEQLPKRVGGVRIHRICVRGFPLHDRRGAGDERRL